MHQSVPDRDLTAEQHLDEDWNLFLRVEAGSEDYLFRTWESPLPVVVVGRNNRIGDHVITDACEHDGIRVLRRFTGGGAVVVGPGCLNYAVVVSLVSRPELADVAGSFRAILGRIVETIDVAGVSLEGGSDLALAGRKVSGNAQRRGRRALLHHGTLLYDFDVTLASRYLKEPRRQPGYRARRLHGDFIGNLPVSGETLRARLAACCAGLGHMHNGAHVPTR
jgi:lipoate-protein ligase A